MSRTFIRTSALVTIAAVAMTIGTVAIPPASASASQYSGGRNEQISAHFNAVHERTTVGMSRYRFPGKKKP